MKTKYFLSLILSLAMQLGWSAPNPPQSGSPFFYIPTEGIEIEDFPLQGTAVDVNITGPIADVTVKQYYQNLGNVPIEAVYIFPASTRAAVYEMEMRIGDRIIKADIQEKLQARATYEKAKSEGKRTSLLEQTRPNVFQMNVGNILPGDEIEITMRYNEFLIPENQEYSFVYPTVVGPRFHDSENSLEAPVVAHASFTPEGVEASYDFDLAILLNAGMPIQKSYSPSHKINVDKKVADKRYVVLDPNESSKGNKDFIYKYSLANNEIAEGTFLYDHGNEKFFLSVVEPPATIVETEMVPREYIFVVDISGSMRGFPIDVSKELMRDLIGKLRPIDKFNVVMFAGSSQVFASKSQSATSTNLNNAFAFIDTPQGGGGTMLLPALQRALALPVDNEINSRSIVVVTDGYVQVEREAFELIRKNLNRANLFSFGIGSSVNRHLIEGMAHAGKGEAFVITKKSEAQVEAARFRKYIQHPLLTNIEMQFVGFDAYEVTPSVLPDLMAERPLYIFGKYRGAAQGYIELKGNQGNKPFAKKIVLHPNLMDGKNSPIRYLWAREKIRWLDDLNYLSQTAEDVKAVTDLGLKYNLLTKFTSFVAVEQNPVVADASQTRKVNQPLPLPEGVSNYAVGFEMKIEGVVKSNASTSASKLFAFVSGDASADFQIKLRKTLQDKIVFSDEERTFLNSNTLELSFDAASQQWEIRGLQKNLSKEFKQQFEELLNTLLQNNSNSFKISISLLWV